MKRRIALLLFAGAWAGCQCDGLDLSGKHFTCRSDADCADGHVCQGGVCAPPGVDAGTADAGVGQDAGPTDAGTRDAGAEDAGPRDAGVRDAGAEDAGPNDAGPNDAGPNDAGVEDAGTVDAGTVLVGYTAIGPTGDSTGSNTVAAFQYVASTTGTSAVIHFYYDGNAPPSPILFGVYDDADGGQPGNLIGQASLNSSATAPQWVSAPLPGVAIDAGTLYWLAFFSPNGAVAYRDFPGGARPPECDENGQASLPATWQNGCSPFPDGPASIYLTAP